ncbi:MAG TPA: hypothetical protein VGP71_08140 [Burkholderiales bacterium]|jgi:hypothetical protein|nr:hypothetical protein [Burkholderiales bacterium]
MDPSNDRFWAEELAYARWLDWGTRSGLAVLVASFFAYALGLAAPHVPFDELAKVWGLPVDQYRAAVGAPAGWGWLALATRGDYLNYFGIAFLALVTALCYLRVLPLLVARNDRIYAFIAVLEIVVLLAAAAGIVGAPH